MPPPDPLREKLRTAIEALRTEERRFASLTDAQERAQQERFALMDAVAAAEKELADAARTAPLERVYAYANRRDVAVEPLAEHQAAVTSATAALERAQELGRDIEAELQRSEVRLQHRKTAATVALAQVVVAAPQFQALLPKRTEAWKQLRTLYVLYGEIFSALSANVPNGIHINFTTHEPLAANRSIRGDNGEHVPFECDEAVLTAWRQALAALRNDHLAELPDDAA